MLNKWDYICSQNLSYQKSFASTKTLNQDQGAYKPLHNGLSILHDKIISMYTEILFYSRLTFGKWRTTLIVIC